jgi:hypothetical protein
MTMIYLKSRSVKVGLLLHVMVVSQYIEQLSSHCPRTVTILS